MSRINGLRDMKREFGSTLKGAVYGAFFGLAITMYISLLISVLLTRIFTSLTGGIDESTLDLVGDIFPSPDTTQDPNEPNYYIAAILTIHAFLSAFLIKQVDGGNIFSMFSDVVYLLWFGAVIEIATAAMFKGMFSTYF